MSMYCSFTENDSRLKLIRNYVNDVKIGINDPEKTLDEIKRELEAFNPDTNISCTEEDIKLFKFAQKDNLIFEHSTLVFKLENRFNNPSIIDIVIEWEDDDTDNIYCPNVEQARFYILSGTDYYLINAERENGYSRFQYGKRKPCLINKQPLALSKYYMSKKEILNYYSLSLSPTENKIILFCKGDMYYSLRNTIILNFDNFTDIGSRFFSKNPSQFKFWVIFKEKISIDDLWKCKAFRDVLYNGVI